MPPANPAVSMHPTDQHGHMLTYAVALSLLLHALLFWGAMRWKATQPPLPKRTTMQLVLKLTPPQALPAPPPPQQAAPPKARSTEPRQVPPTRRLTSPVVTKARPALPVLPVPEPVPGPPQHKMKSATSATPAAAGGTGSGKRGSVYAPSDYVEKVKARVNSAIVYPADAKRFLQQCWVEYTLTVDRNGKMLGYKIDNCGDDRLDASAEAALIKGGPYPPPPDIGASSYEIHGAFVFTLH